MDKAIINHKHIEWTKDTQFDQYKDYAHRLNIPVFVIIGVGDTPSSPKQLFIVPLDDFKTTQVSWDFLRTYKKDLRKNFFWDDKIKKLQ
jgi:hypothetical protein